MNITSDNYEAYLLDYMEGKLSPEGAAELKAFITAQSLDWDELTEDLPHLEAPQIVYENKESLKKKSVVVPLYVKIASAAAAAGLLLTIGLWPEKQLPKVELMTELKPIETPIVPTEPNFLKLPQKSIPIVSPQIIAKEQSVAFEKTEMPLLAELEPIRTNVTQVTRPNAVADESDFEWLTYRMNNSLFFAPVANNDLETLEENEEHLSLIGKSLLWLTNGRHDNFASLIGSGMHKAKHELTEAATDMALMAYYRADERFEEAKERWQEKHEE